jgi:hypothetical protein
MPDEEYYLVHTGEEVDGCIDEVTAARGSSASLSAAISAKQDALTFDSVPTEGSTNPVTSGGVFARQQAQDSAITVVANAGAKNLLNVTGASAQTVTVNSDGTMTVNGTNSGNVSITLGTVTLTAGRYVLSSGVNLPQGVYLSVRVAAGETKYDCTHDVESVEFTVPSDMTMYRVWLFIPKNTTIEDLTIRPMIRRAEIADDTFQPYAPTNRELYEMILALQSGTASANRAVLAPSALESASINDADEDEEVTG